MNVLRDLVERIYGIDPDQWERIVTRTWVFLTLTAVVMATVILGARIAGRSLHDLGSSRIQYASFGLCASYSMIMMRVIWLIHTGSENIPQPWALIFWSIQAALALFFIAAMTLEWGPASGRAFRRWMRDRG